MTAVITAAVGCVAIAPLAAAVADLIITTKQGKRPPPTTWLERVLGIT